MKRLILPLYYIPSLGCQNVNFLTTVTSLQISALMLLEGNGKITLNRGENLGPIMIDLSNVLIACLMNC